MKRYIFLSHSRHLYGAERSLVETIDALFLHETCKISVILPSGFEGGLEEELRMRGVGIYKLKLAYTQWAGYYFSRVRFIWYNGVLFIRMFLLFLVSKPDLFISNTIVNSPVAAICARLLGIPVVWYIHEFGDKDHGYRFLFGIKWTHRLIGLLSSHLIFNSEFIREAFANSFNTPTHVINYGMNYYLAKKRKYMDNYLATGVWKVLVSGRTAPSKGQLDLVVSLRILIDVYHVRNFHVSILGAMESPYLDQLREAVNVRGLNGYVDFVPFQKDPHAYYLKADIGVVTSHIEAFGRVTVDYLKAGLIVVGANGGGTAEILSNFRKECFLYKTGNPEDLAASLLAVFNAPIAALQEKALIQREKATAIYNLENHYQQFKQVVEHLP